jgi:putative heme iron utilization protein
LSSDELRLDLSDAQALVAAEPGAVEHMNADHRDALALYATRLCGAEPGPWRAVGVDPEGMDLGSGETVVRLPFPDRVHDGAGLRGLLVRLAEEARNRTP